MNRNGNSSMASREQRINVVVFGIGLVVVACAYSWWADRIENVTAAAKKRASNVVDNRRAWKLWQRMQVKSRKVRSMSYDSTQSNTPAYRVMSNDDLFFFVWKFLGTKTRDLSACCSVSRAWFRTVSLDRFWQSKLEIRLTDVYFPTKGVPSNRRSFCKCVRWVKAAAAARQRPSNEDTSARTTWRSFCANVLRDRHAKRVISRGAILEHQALEFLKVLSYDVCDSRSPLLKIYPVLKRYCRMYARNERSLNDDDRVERLHFSMRIRPSNTKEKRPIPSKEGWWTAGSLVFTHEAFDKAATSLNVGASFREIYAFFGGRSYRDCIRGI